MRGATAARVLASRSKLAAEGEFVYASTGWTQYAIVSDGTFEPASRYPGLGEPQEMLSVLGLTGITAWWGMIKIGEPKPGETVVISGAAGATGSVAGQIAKIKGARVVGIAGSDDKCKWLVDELGFDAALNYKDADFKQKLKEATPKFIDVFFDNGELPNEPLFPLKLPFTDSAPIQLEARFLTWPWPEPRSMRASLSAETSANTTPASP